MTETADVVVVGGGPVGAACALALAGSGLEIRVLEARAPLSEGAAAADGRPIALSYGSRLILQRLDVWRQLSNATPIERIHVSQAGHFGRVMLDRRETRVPAFGYVADYGKLAAALVCAAQTRLPQYLNGARVHALTRDGDMPVVEYEREGATRAVASRLVVLADGGDLAGARMNIRDYRQTAVTALVQAELPHDHTAYERFTAAGPLALLPVANGMALIWTTDPARATALCAASDAEFLSALQHEFGNRLGRFDSVRARASYPLVLRFAARVALPRVVLIGNAAQTLHPVAGQGFNMGLRDAWELATEIREGLPETLGDAPMLRRVEGRRRIDRMGGIAFTDALVRTFSNDFAPLAVARGAALTLLDCVPALKRFVVHRMTFGARG